MNEGTIVRYMLSAADAADVNRRRVDPDRVRVLLKQNPPVWPAGAMAHVGRPVQAGEVFPLIVVEIEEAGIDDGLLVSGKVQLPGSDTLYVERRSEGEKPGEWTENP